MSHETANEAATGYHAVDEGDITDDGAVVYASKKSNVIFTAPVDDKTADGMALPVKGTREPRSTVSANGNKTCAAVPPRRGACVNVVGEPVASVQGVANVLQFVDVRNLCPRIGDAVVRAGGRRIEVANASITCAYTGRDRCHDSTVACCPGNRNGIRGAITVIGHRIGGDCGCAAREINIRIIKTGYGHVKDDVKYDG